eukprot:g40013.t1
MEQEEVGEVFNDYFILVFTMEKSMDDGKIREGYVDILGHVDIKKEEVLGVLKFIKIDEYPGPDGIYPRMLREVREEIAGALTETFVSSLATGKVPEDWRIANVVPFFEKGNRDNPGYYSLVRLTSAGRPCLTNLAEFSEEVTKMIDEDPKQSKSIEGLVATDYLEDLASTTSSNDHK